MPCLVAVNNKLLHLMTHHPLDQVDTKRLNACRKLRCDV